MTEQQYPTREQIADIEELRKWATMANNLPIGQLVLRVLALFPQPGPSAEPMLLPGRCPSAFEHVPHVWLRDHGGPEQRDMQCPGIAAPPSIADMAPGTTFTAVDPGRLGDRAAFEVLNDHRGRNVDTWVHWHPSSFNSSTIRDVTPAPATPEAY